MGSNMYVQYGCGWNAPQDWRNFDASPTLYFERMPLVGKLYTKNKTRFPHNVEFGDIVEGLPISDGSCKGVYCSHVLEHLPLDDFRKALRNTWRILEVGGLFRLVLPDLEFAIQRYVSTKSPEAAINFIRETGLGRESRNRYLKGFVFEWFGNSNHLWGWDYKSIEVELANVGFSNIRRAKFRDAENPAFAAVESRERWDNCLGVECKK
ncbi:MAG: methyltransferase [Zetaproteobacteria bacterium CG12_big_fil_rev_8_21_14_0_65_55_1124]|nr:MAG: hypothetical protein AUJ58_08500 [Zetaproteobacteria bacterium CG1_02_55_237]PIS19700.1 MAG: methyltransferase [Zetaproteobacteria bacterium CG08_land_8_20_14_0_20_55_17]PIW43467.1 MAG: methyltransferase [Zetaproteobacteria bacterium CG12_big_fil_rev_8_21_14_0_65_55_1124]PIY54098.1 MAG: methyltransferase [Zetaproteobacteria bacterium CG_4_10_14_0_8_um_filter_55_43]PIZ39091.1 MAG: methyltransferase [Zetaproteobacteria bacterium CG_4_10_14_0_2_um_filter_55_20]PJB81504.1 MAG: methyltransf